MSLHLNPRIYIVVRTARANLQGQVINTVAHRSAHCRIILCVAVMRLLLSGGSFIEVQKTTAPGGVTRIGLPVRREKIDSAFRKALFRERRFPYPSVPFGAS